MDRYLGQGMEIGEFGVARVWFQSDEKMCSKNSQNTASDTNPNPNLNPAPAPTHINLSRKNLAFFLVQKLVDHTNSRIIKYSSISTVNPR